MGYTMSPLAQALRKKTSSLIPLIVPDITNPFFAELAKAMTAVAGERGYQLVLCVTGNDASVTSAYLDAMHSLYAPFCVIAPFARVDPREYEPHGFGKRLVVIDRVDADAELSTVTVDSKSGIRLAYEHLLTLGHTGIAYLSGIEGTHTAADRRRAYMSLAKRHKAHALELGGGVGLDAGGRAADEIIRMAHRPTAIIAANDMVAIGLISALGTRGLSVPEDISVIGFDGLALGAAVNPPLTSVRQPIAEMGRIAIDLAELAARGDPVKHVVLRPELIVRSSTKSVVTGAGQRG
jgi:DNA-binding LacI/PurR family transcriptional regulator